MGESQSSKDASSTKGGAGMAKLSPNSHPVFPFLIVKTLSFFSNLCCHMFCRSAGACDTKMHCKFIGQEMRRKEHETECIKPDASGFSDERGH